MAPIVLFGFKEFHTPTTGAVLAKNQDLRRYSQTGPKRDFRIFSNFACSFWYELCCLVSFLARTDGLPTLSVLVKVSKGFPFQNLTHRIHKHPQTSTAPSRRISRNLTIFFSRDVSPQNPDFHPFFNGFYLFFQVYNVNPGLINP